MISVQFFAQDKNDKSKVNSNLFYFTDLNETVIEILEINRKKLLSAMPNARILALITQEESLDDNLFI